MVGVLNTDTGVRAL